jgi:hypothetical protein
MSAALACCAYADRDPSSCGSDAVIAAMNAKADGS